MTSKSLRFLQETTRAKILGFALALFFTLASSGYAADVLYHGSFCNPTTPGSQAVYSQWGVHNGSPVSSLSVHCGGVVAFSGISEIQSVFVTVYDRHPSQDVVCTLETVALEGSAITTTSDSSFGSGVFHQFLGLEPVGSTILTTIHLQCTIPPATAAGVSHVTTYRVITTP